MDHMNAIAMASAEAQRAAQDLLMDWFAGEDRGLCGFAWVTITPEHKGNTKAGREERKKLREMGFELDWTGKRFEWWNPSGLGVQNVDCKYAGAARAARVLERYGFNAIAHQRLD